MAQAHPSSDRVWNSLEVTKLITSAMTALGIFALGYLVTTTNSEETRYRENSAKREAIAREERIRAEGIRRDDLLQERSRREAKTARDEAFARERALQLEAYAREEAMRRATEEREARVRAETRTENLQSRKLERRIEIWNQVAPRAATLYRNMRADLIPQGASGAEARRNIVAKSEALLELVATVDGYRSYFSEEFYSTFTEFSRAAEDALQHSRTPDGPSPEHSLRLGRAYTRLLAAARAELDMESPVPSMSD